MLKELFGVSVLRRMQKGSKSMSVDSIFLSLATFIDRCTEWVEEAPLSEVHVLCTKLMISLMKDGKKGSEC